MNHKTWSIEEINILKNKCLLGCFSYHEIGKILNRSSHSCQNKAKQLKIKNFFKSAKKYDVNKDFWIPNPVSCYWAGFSAADASINKHSSNCYNYRLELSNLDVDHIKQFKNDCNYTGPVKTSVRKNKFIYSRIVVSEPQWVNDLKLYYNIVPNKTLRLSPPNFDDEYLKLCYLIGYIDGDGSICFDKKRNRLIFRIVSSSPDIINWCHKLIMEKFEVFCLKRKENNINLRDGKYSYLTVNGLRAAVLFNFLSKFDLPKLKRKWIQPCVDEYIKNMKISYPEFFVE